MEKLDHPHIVKVFEAGAISGTGYLSMELLKGRTLARLMQEVKQLPLSLLVQIMLPVCDALAYIHARGIIHRDIKSENIFLVGIPSGLNANPKRLQSLFTGEGLRIKLMDFGLARDASMLTLTRQEGLIGTALAAPHTPILKSIYLLTPINCIGGKPWVPANASVTSVKILEFYQDFYR